MPPPRKVDLLPPELKDWLQEELRARGFGGYEEIAESLNFRLEEAGSELRIRKSALHAFGAEYQEFVKFQDQASAWAADWMQDNGLEDEARRHNVLFQMITTLAFKVMQSQMLKQGEEIDPKELHFLGRLMKDVMASSGIRETMAREERKAQAAKLDAAVASGDIDEDAAAKARAIMGFA
ncbi:phage protein Gp27 family protein [Limimaricola variabilis]|uniref:phage protein Gp27 family protein n=1 Tax=Limimaricola variabilis TaxID=1492771 RepID=UPI002AC91D56|nr:phage protein Gp27 family protein [Limimaricola variabilis]WPY94691.1 phage protein Gp27 family protein [Limimaricola variabilis]